MPVATLLLVLFSALTHAVGNAVLKRCREPENAAVGIMFVAGASAGLCALVLRVPVPSKTSAFWSLASGFLEAGYFTSLARAFSRAPLAAAYTVARGGALIVVWPISVLVLHEPITPTRALGAGLVIAGLAATGSAERGLGAGKAAVARRAGIGYAVVAALFIGGFNLTYKVALAAGGAPPAVNVISLTAAAAINVVTLGERRGAALAAARAQPIMVLVGGLLATGGFLVFLTAMKDAGAGIVLTLRSTSILFAQAIAIALGERPKRMGLVGAAVVTVGAVFLAR